VRALARRLERAAAPALVAGPGIDAAGAWDQAVALVERLGLDVWATPAPGGGRLGFPESHPRFRGILVPAIGPAAQMLADHDLVLVVGSSVFPYYPYIPGPALADATSLVAITDDPDEAARAPMGDAIVADVGLALAALLGELEPETGGLRPGQRPAPEPPPPPPAPEAENPLTSTSVHGVLRELLPADAVLVVESPASLTALRDQLRISRPASYYYSSSGGLGFALPASIGIALAQPQRPVLCVLGEGSAQYAITGLWTAAAHRVPVTFLVLNNAEYAILKWFGGLEGVRDVPGLDLPGLDCAAIASAYGVPGRRVTGLEELRAALGDALAAEAPRLVEVDVAPGMARL
jgi:benzoylformate decarboxylase